MATTFDCFPALPVEIQMKIWEEALLDLPGIVLDPDDLLPCDYIAACADAKPRGTVTDVLDRDGDMTYTSPRTPAGPRWMPPLLDAHPNVHLAARTLGLLWDGLLSEPVWFNPSKDALFFSTDNLLSGAWKVTPRHQLRELHRRAEIVVGTQFSFTFGFVFPVLGDQRYFPNIRMVVRVPVSARRGSQGDVVSVPRPSPGRLRFDDLVFLRGTTPPLDLEYLPRASIEVNVLEYRLERPRESACPVELGWMEMRAIVADLEAAEGGLPSVADLHFGNQRRHLWPATGEFLPASVEELKRGYRVTLLTVAW